MPQFHETGYGRTFFEYQLPELIKALNRVADTKRNKMIQNATKNLIKVATDTIDGVDGPDQLQSAIDLAKEALKDVE